LLNPAGGGVSQAYGVGGNQQVGYVNVNYGDLNQHAFLWSGSATSAVDLNPSGLIGTSNSAYDSEAYGTDGKQQVGWANVNGLDHAILWSNTAASAVDLNPAGFNQSEALGISGDQQVGSANGHAFLWFGTAASAVNLDPDDAPSVAYGTNGSQQVGDVGGQAYLWSGTAASAVDLGGTLLPASGTWMASQAYTIDATGNVYGIAEGTFNGVTGDFAVEWSPTVVTSVSWVTQSGYWSTAANWAQYCVPTSTTDVNFNTDSGMSYNVLLTEDSSAKNLNILDDSVALDLSEDSLNISGSLNVNSTGSLTLTGAGTVTAPILNLAGSYTQNAVCATFGLITGGGQMTINGGTTKLTAGGGTSVISSLSLFQSGRLDIVNNSLVINFGAGSDPSATIRGYLASGYAADTWLGPGIESTAAALNPGRYAIGYADGNADQGTPAGPNQVLVEYTLAGDANLDGVVNFADLLSVAQNFNHSLDTHGNPIDWADGDFNYDGVVNFADLLLVAQNFNQRLSASQLQELPGSFSAAWNLALAEVQAANSDNVPEPGSVALLAASGALLMRRTRRPNRQR